MGDGSTAPGGWPGGEEASGRYERAAVVGHGGSATVYRAWQAELNRPVAIKVITTSADPLSLERFGRECLAVGSLSGHPNIVNVYELGRTPTDHPYIVMEYLSGGSLDDRIAPGRGVSWPEVLAIGVQLAGALESAHRAGVLHRDVKPANVLMSRFSEPKLADFGIARIEGGTQTGSGVITATFAHAAPEVVSGAKPSVSSDLYALGSTLFELLRGEPAFASKDPDEGIVPMLARIALDPVPDLRREGIPLEVCNLIERLMAKQPATRPRTAEETGRVIRGVQSRLGQPTTPLPIEGEARAGRDTQGQGGPVTERAVVPPPRPPPDEPGDLTRGVELPAPHVPGSDNSGRRRRRGLPVYAAIAAVVLAAALVLALVGGDRSSGGPEASAASGPVGPEPDAGRPLADVDFGGAEITMGAVEGSQSPENELLAAMLTQVLAAHGAEVRLEGVGSREESRAALLEGEVDATPQYNGYGWATLLGHTDEPPPDPATLTRMVGEEDLRVNQVRWLGRSEFTNSYGFATGLDLTERNGGAFDREAMTALIRDRPDANVCMTEDFRTDDDALARWEAGSDPPLAEDQIRVLTGSQVYADTASGDCAFGAVFTTDPRLAQRNLTVVEDEAFLRYNASFTVRDEAFEGLEEEWTRVTEAILEGLDAPTMARLNQAASEQPVADVVRSYLLSQGMLT